MYAVASARGFFNWCQKRRLTLVLGLRWHPGGGRPESLAADHVAVAELMHPKALAVFHDKVEVVGVRDLLIDAAARRPGMTESERTSS